jgi:ADP-ribose pyrophosphatase
MKVIDLELADCELLGDGGFSRLRRCRARNVLEDGSRSPAYTLDMVERPGRADAVAVLPCGAADPVRVLLRRGLRPALRLARSGQPTREGTEPGILHLEAVSGILEPADQGEEGLRRRAAAELEEEAGLLVDHGQVQQLGPPVCLSPGLMAERIYFCWVPARLDARDVRPAGDGSLLEQGAETVVLELDQALEECARGVIQDAKTEIALRRLKQQLTASGSGV